MRGQCVETLNSGICNEEGRGRSLAAAVVFSAVPLMSRELLVVVTEFVGTLLSRVNVTRPFRRPLAVPPQSKVFLCSGHGSCSELAVSQTLGTSGLDCSTQPAVQPQQDLTDHRVFWTREPVHLNLRREHPSTRLVTIIFCHAGNVPTTRVMLCPGVDFRRFPRMCKWWTLCLLETGHVTDCHRPGRPPPNVHQRTTPTPPRTPNAMESVTCQLQLPRPPSEAVNPLDFAGRPGSRASGQRAGPEFVVDRMLARREMYLEHFTW